MRVLQTKLNARWCRKQGINDRGLRDAVDRAERGIVDADLGGGVIKQRVPRAGQGRSGGFRMMIAFRSEQRAVFLYGFAKSERENISDQQVLDLRELGAALLDATDHDINRAVSDGTLKEVEHDKEPGARPADEDDPADSG